MNRKKYKQDIIQFGLSPIAKAGVLITNMKDQPGKDAHDISTPHRDNHYLLMIATHGSYELNLDFNEIKFSAPALLAVIPGQVHHILDVKKPQGWIISFDPAVIDKEFQQILENKFINPMLLKQKSAFYEQVVALTHLIEKLQSGIQDSFTGKSIHLLLNTLLSLISGSIIKIATNTVTPKNRGVAIEQAFSQLLKQHFKAWKQPAQYASKLSISVAHLNDTVKSITGSSVSANIQKFSILEAKRLLYFTDKPVKEVGYEVGYTEPVYFGKLFKKVTGITPFQFRQQFHV